MNFTSFIATGRWLLTSIAMRRRFYRDATLAGLTHQ